MTKQEHIIFWKQAALEDSDTIQVLFAGGRYMMCLFVCHLMIEKLLKAHWVKDNAEHVPPFTHNLELLHNQTHLGLALEDVANLRLINAWNIEGRYVDYKQNFYKLCTRDYTEKQLLIIETLKQCLLNKLP
jgi:HEPN domain-containing protein